MLPFCKLERFPILLILIVLHDTFADIESVSVLITMNQNCNCENKSNVSYLVNEFVDRVGVDTQVNSFKDEQLRNILNESLSRSTVTCESDKLTIEAHIVRVSEIRVSQECVDTVKFIEIFAWEKFIMDANINWHPTWKRQELQVSIIAPIWEIVGLRNISLSGTTGPMHSPAAENEKGVEGIPGTNAGRILCIGSTFINPEFLQITLDGGDGGPGQTGGRG